MPEVLYCCRKQVNPVKNLHNWKTFHMTFWRRLNIGNDSKQGLNTMCFYGIIKITMILSF